MTERQQSLAVAIGCAFYAVGLGAGVVILAVLLFGG